MPCSALPITPARFREALHTIWQPRETGSYKRPGTGDVLGLAVSGGVDSMALAYLCSRLQKEGKIKTTNAPRLRFRAFIVDHRFRSDSGEEARKVALKMRKLCIPSTILRLDSKAPNQWNLKNFETEARKLRYRALGRACRIFRIRGLLCAHHNDDQAETVLVRILSQKTHVGLQGMRAASVFPECDGIYGVHESGDIVGNASIPPSLRHDKVEIPVRGVPRDVHSNENSTEIQMATGGIYLYRPLLGFDKHELIATCEQSGTDWHEDPTNQDMNLTIRNTIRQLLDSNRLPLALRKPALLKLSNHWRGISKQREQASEALFQQLDIQCNLRSGTLVFSLKNHDSVVDSGSFQVDNANVAVRLLQKIQFVVSPKSRIGKDEMANLLPSIFPNLSHPGTRIKASKDTRFTDGLGIRRSCGGIQWSELTLEANSARRFALTRHPIYQNNKESIVRCWTSSSEEATKPPRFSEVAPKICQEFWTWQLWDNRFWLRVYHQSAGKIIARTPSAEELAAFRKGLYDSQIRKRFECLLKMSAPGNMRFTLPVLAESMEGPVLAFPTLGFALPSVRTSLRWQVLYKKIVSPWSVKGSA